MRWVPSLTIWDFVLILVVSTQATILAYVYEPKWKALILLLPFPFTIATLAVGTGVDITGVVGLVLLIIFTHGVRLLHYRVKVPIIPSIVISAGVYCGLGTLLAAVLPRTELAFWVAAALVFLLGLTLYRVVPHRVEPGNRSLLPVYVKLPIIAVVISLLIVLKAQMQGFITVFPMVGVISAYEGRRSLWTISREIPVLTFTLLPMMCVVRLAQSSLGLPAALALGWVVNLGMLILVTRARWARDERQVLARAAADA